MTELDQPTAVRRRRFRFGLRTSLAVVTVAAVGSWGYWVGWPWWQVYLEQKRFEYAAKQIKLGMTVDEASRILSKGVGQPPMHKGTKCDNNKCQGDIYFETGHAAYVGFFQIQQVADGSNNVIKTMEFFRLPLPPSNYSAQSERARRLSSEAVSLLGITVSEMLPETYRVDFVEYLSSDRKSNPGFQCELIYSDPPAK